MLNSELNLLSLSESDKLKSMLKNPKDDFQEIVSLIEKKVEESKKQQKESESRYLHLFNNFPISISIFDFKGNLVESNKVVIKKLAKYANVNFVGKNYIDIISHFQNADQLLRLFKERLKAMRKGENPGPVELLLVSKNEEKIWLYWQSSRFEINNEIFFQVLIQDITEQKKAEEKLKESEEKFRTIAEQSLIGIGIVQDNIVKYANIKLAEIFGYTTDEMLYWTSEEFLKTVHPDDKEFVQHQASVKQQGLDDYLRNYEFRGVKKSGESIWIENYTKSITFEGRPANFVALIDITDRRKVEEELRKTEERFRSMIDNTTDAVFCYEFDPPIPIDLPIEEQVKLMYDCILVDCNLTCAKSYGFNNIEAVIGRKLTNLFGTTPKSLDILFRNMIKSGYRIFDGVGIEKIPGEEDRYYLNNGYGVIEDNKLLRIWGTFRDITETKRAEKKLKETERYLSNIITSIQDGLCVLDKDFNVISINPKMEEWFPLSKPIIDKKCYQAFCNKTKLYEDCECKNILNSNEPFCKSELYKESNGKIDKIFNVYTYPLYDQETGDVKGIIKYMRDITDQKKAEQKLKESEENFRTIAEDSHLAITILQDDLVVYTNQRMADMFGYDREEMSTWTPKEYAKTVAEDSLEFVMEQARKKQIGDPDVISQYPIHCIKSSGEKFWVDNISTTIIYNGRPADLVTIIDTTEKREAEQKLKESEQKFRNIAEQSLMGIIILQDGLFKYFNDRISEMNGYSAEEMKDWAPDEFIKAIYSEDRDFVMDQARKKQAGDRDVIHQYRYRTLRKNGEIRWMEIFSKTIAYEGRPADLAMIIDIDDEIKAEQQLKESEEKFRKITEESLLAICIIQDDRIKYINQEMVNLYGYTMEEMLNWGPGELLKTITPESLETVREQLTKKQTGDPDIITHYPIHCIRSNGELFWVDNLSKTMMYEGRPADLVTQIDITERTKAQQELVKLNQLKSELLRRTSHELKTPLVSIKGFSELLLEVHRDKLDALIISTLNEIQQGCLRLENLIGDILKTAELESGVTQLNKSEENLSFLVRVCVNEIKGFSKLRNHKINLDLHEKLITQFEKEQIHQVISNLLNNAVKYTPPNGLIEIKSVIKDDFIILLIKDNGIGFTEEEKTRLFKQFGKIERYGQGLDIIAEGSGFGLFISKKIMELHGGDIWVKSEGRNKGSTFYISLPLN